jgi:hypothetical protein
MTALGHRSSLPGAAPFARQPSSSFAYRAPLWDVHSAYPPALGARPSRNGIGAEGPHWPKDREGRPSAPVYWRPRKSSGSETTKSSGSETTFERDLIASAEIEAGVEAMADDVWAWCDKAKAFGRTVTVKVKFADFRQVARSRSFSTVIARQVPCRWADLDAIQHARRRK